METHSARPVGVAVPATRAPRCLLPGQAPQPFDSRRGLGRAVVEWIDGASAVVSCASSTPLRLLTPVPRGRAAWIVAASHGGGLVGGDRVDLALTVGPGASAFLGTQAETKVYRPAAGAGAAQSLIAEVGAGGFLAVLPDPVSPYAGARYDQVQRFHLAAGASLVLLDAVTAGRAARGERWLFSRYRAATEVAVDGAIALADAIHLEAGRGPPLADRLQGFELLATAVLLGPAAAAGAAALLDAIARTPADGRAPVLTAASPIAGGALLRLAARSVEQGMAVLRAHLSFAREPLDGDPLLRRP